MTKLWHAQRLKVHCVTVVLLDFCFGTAMWNHNHLAVKWSPREIIKPPGDPWCICCRYVAGEPPISNNGTQYTVRLIRLIDGFYVENHHFFSFFIGGEWVNYGSWSWFSNDFAQPNNFLWPWPSFSVQIMFLFIYLWVMVMVSIAMLNNHKASQLELLSHVAWRLCDTPYKVMPHGPQLNW